MKQRITTRSHWVILYALLILSAVVGRAQFVEVTVQIVGVSEKVGDAGATNEVYYTNEVQCVVGTNLWRIEGDLSENAHDTWWCTASNIVKRTVITKDSPQADKLAGKVLPVMIFAPKAGESFLSFFSKTQRQPLHGVANIAWLAFGSGAFLEAKGRQLVPPFPVRVKDDAITDQTEVFNGAPKLPKQVKLFERGENLIFTYEATRSTNFAGWIIPMEFEAVMYGVPPAPSKPRGRWRGVVTAIRTGGEPVLPAEIVKAMTPITREEFRARQTQQKPEESGRPKRAF
jgi:hypothetical protein